MDNLDLVRIASVVMLVCWLACCSITLPVIIRSHPTRHPTLMLLMTLAIIDTVIAGLLVDVSLTAKHVRDLRDVAPVISVRVLGVAAAAFYVAIILRVKKS